MQAKQAKEHDKQQDHVGREVAESVKIGNLGVGHRTSSLPGYRLNADLGMDESMMSTTIEVDYSPARWLIRWHI